MENVLAVSGAPSSLYRSERPSLYMNLFLFGMLRLRPIRSPKWVNPFR